jgi:hypothetical protein
VPRISYLSRMGSWGHRAHPARPKSPPRRQPTALRESQLNLEDCPYTGGSVADDLELEVVGSVLDIDPVDEGERQPQELFEQGKDEANDGNNGLQQEANNMSRVMTRRGAVTIVIATTSSSTTRSTRTRMIGNHVLRSGSGRPRLKTA